MYRIIFVPCLISCSANSPCPAMRDGPTRTRIFTTVCLLKVSGMCCECCRRSQGDIGRSPPLPPEQRATPGTEGDRTFLVYTRRSPVDDHRQGLDTGG